MDLPSFKRVSHAEVIRTCLRNGVVVSEVVEGPQVQLLALRQKYALSQSKCALLLNTSVRTLQEWEQGRKKPSGAAVTLIRVLHEYPEAAVKLLSEI